MSFQIPQLLNIILNLCYVDFKKKYLWKWETESLWSGYENKSLPGLSLICMCCKLLGNELILHMTSLLGFNNSGAYGFL